MIVRIVKRRQVSGKTNFAIIFCTSFLYKFFISWRTGIENGWQDEIGWRVFAMTHTFLETISEYDAGYPTPLLRGLSYILSLNSSDNFIIWHMNVLMLISASIASVAFCRIWSNKTNFLIAGLICSYPSFDLLLLHNLSYWAYIPLFVALINVVSAKVKLSIWMSLAVISLIFAAAKPQILLSLLTLIGFSIALKLELRSRLVIFAFPISILFLAGRLSKSSLNLDLDLPSAVNLALTVWSHFFTVFASVPTILFFTTAKYFGIGLIVTAYFIAANLIFLKAYFLSNDAENSALVISVFSSFVIGVSSLYIFTNSGWSQNGLLSSDEYTSLFSRHYLPVVLNITFLVAIRFGKHRVFKYLITLAILQNVFLQLALFHQLYKPI